MKVMVIGVEIHSNSACFFLSSCTPSLSLLSFLSLTLLYQSLGFADHDQIDFDPSKN